jgi:mycothiol synthase
LKIVSLNTDNVKNFIAYCKKHAREQDESFIPQDDYTVRTEELVYLLLDNESKVVGAAALMLYKEYIDIKKARFRIFHCIEKSYENYKVLLDKIIEHKLNVDFIYCFIDEKNRIARDIWEKLGFGIWRYSWVLEKDTTSFTAAEFPAGYMIKTMEEGKDEQAWCDIVNEAFAAMHGHTHLSPQKIAYWKKSAEFIDGGLKMLWHNDKPVGTIAMIKETENGENVIFIEAVAILNSYQGRGLGKNLLRYAVEFTNKNGFKKIMLSVNAENESAAELYLKEGFKKIEVVVCYHKKVN